MFLRTLARGRMAGSHLGRHPAGPLPPPGTLARSRMKAACGFWGKVYILPAFFPANDPGAARRLGAMVLADAACSGGDTGRLAGGGGVAGVRP